MSGPLEGVRVIEVCKGIAGGYCASLLGDMGADVIKIEAPGEGDEFRVASPVVKGESYYFMLANRNKRSLTLNLKDERGKSILLRLVRDADILIENLRPGSMKRLGLDYGSLEAVNPRLLYCSISGFGQDGPYKDRAAYDLVLQAMGGMMSITGQPGGDPTYAGFPVVDVLTALFAVYGVLSALAGRQRTGKGQHIDACLYDSSIAPLMQLAGVYLATGEVPRPGQKEKVFVPYGLFKARDGSFVLEAGSRGTWQRLCAALGLDDMIDDPRFVTHVSRAKNRDLVLARLNRAFSGMSKRECLKVLAENGVPAGPVRNLDEVFKDKHTLYRKMLVEVNHPKLGPTKLIGLPVKLSSTPASIAIPPPLVGQHTDEVLREVGLSRAQIRELRAQKVV